MSAWELLKWLEQTPISVLIREHVWGQPILIAVHMLALTGSVGTLVWFDLRLLGISLRRCSISRLYRVLKPWMFASFFLMVVSGSMLFMAYATLAYDNFFFRVKAAGFALAGVNMLIYHWGTKRGISRWDESPQPPLAAQIAGLVSILAWAMIIVSGRMMAYTMYGIAS